MINETTVVFIFVCLPKGVYFSLVIWPFYHFNDWSRWFLSYIFQWFQNIHYFYQDLIKLITTIFNFLILNSPLIVSNLYVSDYPFVQYFPSFFFQVRCTLLEVHGTFLPAYFHPIVDSETYSSIQITHLSYNQNQ